MPSGFLHNELGPFSTLLLFLIKALSVPGLVILLGHPQILFLTEIGEYVFMRIRIDADGCRGTILFLRLFVVDSKLGTGRRRIWR